jgi:hypothetical protein
MIRVLNTGILYRIFLCSTPLCGVQILNQYPDYRYVLQLNAGLFFKTGLFIVVFFDFRMGKQMRR